MTLSSMSSGPFSVRVWTGGEGTPLLYLHGFEQHPGDAPFLHRLARSHEVLAPEHPGYGPSQELGSLRDIHDLALYYRQLLETWDKGAVAVVGHSLGSMFAAELAIVAPHLVRKLVLVAPYGLWDDEQPLPDPFTMAPQKLAEAKWHDPAKAEWEPSSFEDGDGQDRAAFTTTNLTAAAKFMWPLPDRGLRRRLPHLRAPTQLVFGASDRLVPASYETLWREAIPGARSTCIPNAGHLPMVEAEDAFIAVVEAFLR